MGFFNFIETFFFLSLGITFVLILLLVYHFKQRLTALENKSDTVFDILNNIVKELTETRQTQVKLYSEMLRYQPSYNFQTANNRHIISPNMNAYEVSEKIKVSDGDF
jgi:hypothetical protein